MTSAQSDVPASAGQWRMPAEHEPHSRTWMAFPAPGYSLGDTEDDHHEARTAWSAVANAIVDHEPVTVVVDPTQTEHARKYLSGAVDIVEAPLNDAWMRDIGPTFVVADDGSVAGVDWVFNGWGGQEWAAWDRDQHIARNIIERTGVELIDSDLVNEGGGIQVDGIGTVLVTETVQLDPGRNPSLSKADVEAELTRTLGVSTIIWLPRGLTRDSEEFGTRGHVDIVAAMPSPGTVILHDQRNPEHPDYVVSRQLRELLTSATNAAGEPLRVIDVPAPVTLTDDEGFVDYSYINHYVANGVVIACSFDDASDAEAAAILGSVYPGREVVTVDARAIFARGGGIHCITQNQPA
ncbi:agmatine deiminase family protein [Gordonia sp. TBRC 11910]|uniref:Agmatine deiminase family protein n=1 Tax=Gordonia asplenii TaxID=2725283 RepID=A0A848L0A8_9ACTN|nr:agmatine deiminase family protein [Gordonia asplenii]NMO04256.1 agmatine deiminase family protein [Gordonia asplenii]